MKFEFEYLGGYIKIRITYPKKIWETLEKIYQENRLIRTRVTRPWGLEDTENDNIEAYVYRSNSINPFAEVINKILYNNGNIGIIDDVNRPLLDRPNLVNIAFLRIIPRCDERECVTETTAPINVYNINLLKMMPKILIEIIKQLRELSKPKIAKITIEFR
jgi:hypothetical protein